MCVSLNIHCLTFRLLQNKHVHASAASSGVYSHEFQPIYTQTVHTNSLYFILEYSHTDNNAASCAIFC